MMRRRWSAVLTGLIVMMSACSQPDATHFSAPPVTPADTSTLESSDSSAESSLPLSTTSGSATESPISSTTSTSVAVDIGAGAVVPWGVVTQEDINRAVTLVADLSLQQKAGSVIMASSADAVGTSAVGDLGLGGVILMGSKGIPDGTKGGTPSQVLAVTNQLSGQLPADLAGFSLLIGTDQEYGDVVRMVNGFTDLPGEGDLGSITNLNAAIDATQKAAAVSGAELAAVGVNINFAPVSDLLPLRGASEMTGRSYGSDPQRDAALVTAAVAGYQSVGVAATLKHFPGIGELKADTHTTLSTLTADCETWNSRASVPIRAGTDAGVSLVMTGHALFPAVDTGSEPTSLSSVVVSELLRGNPASALGAGCTPLGFHGLAITDSLQMAPIVNGYSNGDAAWQALAAGQDLLLMPVKPADAITGITEAVSSGKLAETRLNEAAVRVFALRSALSRTERPDLDTVGSSAHRDVADQVWGLIR